MENEIKVSVICLAYNHEKYIRKCLDGFVMQKTNFKFEVLVHDDASTDDTADIIREYAEKYPEIIKPIFQTENQYSKGVKIGRTFLYPIAKGKYIAWCEGDDYWCDENKLQLQYDAMEAHPECSLCVHTVQIINEDGSFYDGCLPRKGLGFIAGIINEATIKRSFLSSNSVHFQTNSLFLRSEYIINSSSFSERLRPYFNGDEVIWRTALSTGKIYYIDEVLSHYRRFSQDSWTSRFSKKTNEEKMAVYKKMALGELEFDLLTNHQFAPEIRSGIMRRVCDISSCSAQEGHRMIIICNIKTREIVFSRGLSLKNRGRLLLCKISPWLLSKLERAIK